MTADHCRVAALVPHGDDAKHCSDYCIITADPDQPQKRGPVFTSTNFMLRCPASLPRWRNW
ncbi:hypothetical protein ACO7_470046 [Thiomonas arsenitoxydans]|nr:hypothetical protein THICB6_200049 [Thiomonas arsenitoxydans]CQR35921.1 hypothetical protein ACO7_470046 [Thiomonas arsenitoxydans]CQR36017.1 hypothetical protein ACO3_470047 [Thiomonas arsenitoxydans]